MSHIEIILGPMFSGKSTELLRRINRYKIAKKKVLVVKYIMDIRYSETEMSTHDKQSVPAFPCKILNELDSIYQNYDVIGIDEGQFFPDIVEFSEKAANFGKIIIIAALDGTFQRMPFGNILALIPLAEKVCKLSAICAHCSNSASFTHRTICSKEIQVIGGAESYTPLCRNCFLQANSEQNESKLFKNNQNSLIGKNLNRIIKENDEINQVENSP